jgi:hypothetical protein
MIFVAGGFFGTGLALSGMTDPARVLGFLDIFGAWDPALLFVMAGAVGVYGSGMLILRRCATQDTSALGRFNALTTPRLNELRSSSPMTAVLSSEPGFSEWAGDWAASAQGLRSPIWARFVPKHSSSYRPWLSACCWRKDSSEPTVRRLCASPDNSTSSLRAQAEDR